MKSKFIFELFVMFRNDSPHLPNLLKSLETMCPFDRIVFVDTGATDNSQNIVASFIANNKIPKTVEFTLSSYAWRNDFSDARNYCMTLLKRDSIWMWLDADDTYTKESGEEFRRLAEQLNDRSYKNIGYSLPYWYVVDNDNKPVVVQYRERIMRDPQCFKWVGRVHENAVCVTTTDGRMWMESNCEVIHKPSNYGRTPERNLNILRDELLCTDKPAFKTYVLALKELCTRGLYKEASLLIPRIGLPDHDMPSMLMYEYRRLYAKILLNIVLDSTARSASAIRELTEAINLVPKFNEARLELIDLYIANKHYDQAHKAAQELSVVEPVTEWPIEKDNYSEHFVKSVRLCVDTYKISMPNKFILEKYEDALQELLDYNKPRNKWFVEAENNLKKLVRQYPTHITTSESTNLKHVKDYLNVTMQLDVALNIAKIHNKWDIGPLNTSLSTFYGIGDYTGARLTQGNIVIYAPAMEHWDGLSPRVNGIGASESSLVALAEEFHKKGYSVTVASYPKEEKTINGVRYVNYDQHRFENNLYDVAIYSRELHKVSRTNAGKVFLWLHDNLTRIPDDVLRSVDGVVTVSYDARDRLVNADKSKIHTIYNLRIDEENQGSLLSWQEDALASYSFVSASSLDRCFQHIEAINNAAKDSWSDLFYNNKIAFFYGVQNMLNVGHREMVHTYDRKFNMLADKMTNFGRVPIGTIRGVFRQVQALVYPSDFVETQCMTVVEAALAGSRLYISGNGAVKETALNLTENNPHDNGQLCWPNGIRAFNKEKHSAKWVESLYNHKMRSRMVLDAMHYPSNNELSDRWLQMINCS